MGWCSLFYLKMILFQIHLEFWIFCNANFIWDFNFFIDKTILWQLLLSGFINIKWYLDCSYQTKLWENNFLVNILYKTPKRKLFVLCYQKERHLSQKFLSFEFFLVSKEFRFREKFWTKCFDEIIIHKKWK